MKIKLISLMSLLMCSHSLFAETLAGDLGNGRTIIYEKVKKKELDIDCSNKIINGFVADFKNKEKFSLKELMVDNKSLKIKKVLLSKDTYLIKDKNKVAFLIDPSVKGRVLITHGIFKGQKIEDQKWNLWNYKNKISFNSCFVKEIPKVIEKKKEEKINTLKNSKKEIINSNISIQPKKEVNVENKKQDLEKSKEAIVDNIKSDEVIEINTPSNNEAEKVDGLTIDSQVMKKEEKTINNKNAIPLIEVPKGGFINNTKEDLIEVNKETSRQYEKEKNTKKDLTLPKIEKNIAENFIKNDDDSVIEKNKATPKKEIALELKKDNKEEKIVESKKIEVNNNIIKKDDGSSVLVSKNKNEIKLLPKKKMTEKMIRKEKDAKIVNSSIESMKEKSISNSVIKISPKTRLCIMEETEKMVSKKYPNYEITDFKESAEFKEHMDQSMMIAINFCANKK